MVTTAQLEPVVRAVFDDTGAIRADALCALIELDVTVEQWLSLGIPFRQLLDEPNVDFAGLAPSLARVPLASVHRRLHDAARTAPPNERVALLTALRSAGAADVDGPLVDHWLSRLGEAPGTDEEAVHALACLPIEDHSVTVDAFRPALGAGGAIGVFGALAVARLGDLTALDAFLDDVRDGHGPSIVHGNPWATYEDFAAARPLPPGLVEHLTGRLDDTEESEPTRERLVLGALTGLTNADGDRIEQAGITAETVVVQTEADAEPEPPTEKDLDALHRVVAQLRDIAAGAWSRDVPTAATADLTPREAGRLLTARVIDTLRATGADERFAALAGNEVVRDVAQLRTPRHIDLKRIASAYESAPHPFPPDQLGWVLAQAFDDQLLDQFSQLLRDRHLSRRATAAHLLALTLAQRGKECRMYGAGPSASASQALPPPVLINDEELPAAAPPPPPRAAPPRRRTASKRLRRDGRGAATRAGHPLGEPRIGGRAPTRDELRDMRGRKRDDLAPAPRPRAARPQPEQPRRLHAEIRESETGRRRTNAFAPGARHDIGVSIGPGEPGPLTLAGPFPESSVRFEPYGAILDVEFVAESPEGTVRETQQLLLPKSGPSARLTFRLDVATDAMEVRASVIVYQGALVLQSAQLRGPVDVNDRPVNRQGIRFVRDSEVAPARRPEKRDGEILQPAADVDTSLSFNVGAAGEALLVDGDGHRRVVSLEGLDEFRRQVVRTLRVAVDADRATGAVPGSEQQTELLRDLARLGYTLYDQLADQIRGVTVGPRIQLVSLGDDVVPLEFVYDYGLPTESARLAAHWQEALATGHCDCRPRRGRTRLICPLGFWALRYVLEHQLAGSGDEDESIALPGQLRRGHETLPRLDKVLFAATSKIDATSRGEREKTVKLLQDRLHHGVVEATSWSGWHDVMRTHKPGLVLSLPHTDRVGDLVALQIGRTSIREVAALTGDYVVPPGAPVGPVVFLLGCSTASEDIPWQSSVAAFRRGGASLVVGTLVETLGRQTAPMARLLTEQLWGTQPARGATIGETLRDTRRRLVADGATLGLSLVVFGQSGWRVPKRRGGM